MKRSAGTIAAMTFGGFAMGCIIVAIEWANKLGS